MTAIDLAVVGAGPAGLAAAITAARCGLSVTLFDENATPGGQIYRAITTADAATRDVLGADYARGAPLVEAFRASGAAYAPATTLWAVAQCEEAGFDLALQGGRAAAVHARAMIVATGALERPLPVPGWTLPGVMMAGAAQSLLKSSKLVAQGPTVMAGNGPLLWLVAWQHLRAGAPIAALLDTTPRGRLAHVLRLVPSFIASPYFAKGRELAREVRKRVRVIEYVDDVAIEGTQMAAAVRFRVRDRGEAIEARHVFLHQGVVPDVRLASALGCALRWNEASACFEPLTDVWGGSSLPGVFFAGDAAGVAGADAARARGELAALAVANAQGRIDGGTRDRAAQAPLRALVQAMRGRSFLDALYRPADRFRTARGDTLACRCEEVPARAIATLARDAGLGPNDIKACTRAGMGLCQGRYCALTVAEIVAREQRRAVSEIGTFRSRFPLVPVSLADVASLPSTPADRAAVERSGE